MGRQNGGGRQGRRIRTGQRGGRQDQCRGRGRGRRGNLCPHGRGRGLRPRRRRGGSSGTGRHDELLIDKKHRGEPRSLDDYEKETALASFPADSDGQNESRLLVEDEDGVSREVVVPRLRPGRLSARPPRLRSCPGTGGRPRRIFHGVRAGGTRVRPNGGDQGRDGVLVAQAVGDGRGGRQQSRDEAELAASGGGGIDKDRKAGAGGGGGGC